MHVHAPLKILDSDRKICWRCQVKKVTKDPSIHYAVCKTCYKVLCEERHQADRKSHKKWKERKQKQWREKWVEQLNTQLAVQATLFDADRSTSNIKYPNKTPEVEIQARIFGLLTEKGYDVHLEVRENECKFDVVVFRKDKKAALIIETKRHDDLEDKEQLQRYRRTGIPVVSISSMVEAVYFCEWFSRNSRHLLALPKR